MYKVAYFVAHDIAYQLRKFQCCRMSESNFIEGGGTPPPPPPSGTTRKKLSTYRV